MINIKFNFKFFVKFIFGIKSKLIKRDLNYFNEFYDLRRNKKQVKTNLNIKRNPVEMLKNNYIEGK